jgi:hypothetical protein
LIAVHVPVQLVVVRVRVQGAGHRVADAVGLRAAHGAVGVADLDLGHRVAGADLVGHAAPGRVGHAPHGEAIQPIVGVVVLIPGRDVAEDAVLLQAVEIDVDRLDDRERPVGPDRDVGAEPVDDPAGVRGGGRGRGRDDHDDGDEPQEAFTRRRCYRCVCARMRDVTWRCVR